MEYRIENEYLSVTVSEKGGELQSVYDKKAGRELLWQGDPAFWEDRAPNLFPYIARMTDGKYVYRGKTYEMRIHGMVMYSVLEAEHSEKELSFTLRSDEKTRESYPFDFVYRVRYRLENSTVVMTYEVENRDEKTMYFGLGGHPGFRVPFVEGTEFEHYEVEFPNKTHPERILFSDDCFVIGKAPFEGLEGDHLPLVHALFDADAIVLEHAGDEAVLKCTEDSSAIRIRYGKMRYLGLWHCPGTKAPYVCVEPWSSLPSRKNIVEDLEKQDNLLSLMPGQTYSDTIRISIEL